MHIDAVGGGSAPRPTPSRAEVQADVQRIAASGDLEAAKAFLAARPDQQEALFNALVHTRPGLIYDLVEASAQVDVRALEAAAAPQPEPTLGNRVWGGVRAVGGTLEAVGGGALFLTPEPTMLTKVGGGVMIAHGADNAAAGFRQLWTGLPAESLTQQAGAGAARALGADEATAQRVGAGVDIAVGLTGAGLATAGRLASRTSMVWDSVKATQPVYQGTVIPRSFELATGSGRVWVHGNGTKHLAEYATGMLGRGTNPQLVQVASQVQLTSLRAAVDSAMKGGVQYDKLLRVGGWELIFSAPRQAGQLPVLKHALPLR